MPTDYGPVCREHLEFMKWADNILLSAVQQVPQDQLILDRHNSFNSLFDTINHIYLAELIWLRKVTVNPNIQMNQLPTPANLTELAAAWPDVHQQWTNWARPRSSDQWAEELHFQSRILGQAHLTYSQIVLHVVNHGSYHRGQLTTMLRQAGITPPGTDLSLFYRSQQ